MTERSRKFAKVNLTLTGIQVLVDSHMRRWRIEDGAIRTERVCQVDVVEPAICQRQLFTRCPLQVEGMRDTVEVAEARIAGRVDDLKCPCRRFDEVVGVRLHGDRESGVGKVRAQIAERAQERISARRHPPGVS